MPDFGPSETSPIATRTKWMRTSPWDDPRRRGTGSASDDSGAGGALATASEAHHRARAGRLLAAQGHRRAGLRADQTGSRLPPLLAARAGQSGCRVGPRVPLPQPAQSVSSPRALASGNPLGHGRSVASLHEVATGRDRQPNAYGWGARGERRGAAALSSNETITTERCRALPVRAMPDRLLVRREQPEARPHATLERPERGAVDEGAHRDHDDHD